LHFQLTKTRPDTLPASLFKPFNKSLALSYLLHSTLDYHIQISLHQLHIDPLVDPLQHTTTLLHKSQERAYRNILRTTISSLWQMEILNHAPLYLPHINSRKASYIHIARDDLQRRDHFKPAQYLRSHLDQLPLPQLRTQATSYIQSHFNLVNDHTYTPYDQRYCHSCLPIQIVGNELHSLLHCPHSSPLSHPAILSLTRALRRYDLCSWSSHTPLHQTTILLGSSPPKLLCNHDKAWIYYTSTTCTQLIYSLQSHFFEHQPSASPRPALSLTSSPASPLSDDTQGQVCHSPFDEEKMLLCDMCNAGWHMDCLPPPLTTIPAGIWKCLLCTPAASLSQGPLRLLRFLCPILDPDSDKTPPMAQKYSLFETLRRFPLSSQHTSHPLCGCLINSTCHVFHQSHSAHNPRRS